MKKWLLLILILCCGCSKKEFAIETFVETKNNIYIAMTYPKTGTPLDKKILDYVEKSYDAFKEEYEDFSSLALESEFNIDYEYWEVEDRYSNVILTTFLNSSSLAHPIEEIKTFVFDKKENKVLTIQDLLNNEMVLKLVPMIKQEMIKKYKDCIILESLDTEITKEFKDIEFTFNEEKIIFYFNPYKITSGNCGIVSIEIPLSRLGLSFSKPTFQENKFVVEHSNSVIDPQRPVVAITFDDGPSQYTQDILDVLKQKDASATFFVLGNKVNAYSKTIQRMVLEGHEIGNHSYNHKWLTRLEIEDFKEQIDKTQELIQGITGTAPRLLRPTYGSVNKKIRSNTDLEIVLWDVDSLDWKIKDSKKIADRVLKDVEDLDIILFHDIKKRTVEAVDIVISKLQEEGFQFVTVSDLEEVKKLRKIDN